MSFLPIRLAKLHGIYSSMAEINTSTGFLSEFSLGSSDAAEVMNKADEYLQVYNQIIISRQSRNITKFCTIIFTGFLYRCLVRGWQV